MFPADCAQQEVYTWATGSAAPKDPPIGTQVLPTPQVQIPHLPHTMAPGVCSLMQHKSTLQPTGNARRKYPVSGKKPQAWALAHLLENKRDVSNRQPSELKEPQRTEKFKNSSTIVRNKSGTGIPIHRQRKPQLITTLISKISYLEISSKDLRRCLLLQMWKQQHKLQGTWKIKETYHHQKIIIHYPSSEAWSFVFYLVKNSK